MELSKAKDISRLVDKKLQRAAKKEERRKKELEEELDQENDQDINEDHHSDESADQSSDQSDGVVKKVILIGAVGALLFGSYNLIRERLTHGE